MAVGGMCWGTRDWCCGAQAGPTLLRSNYLALVTSCPFPSQQLPSCNPHQKLLPVVVCTGCWASMVVGCHQHWGCPAAVWQELARALGGLAVTLSGTGSTLMPPLPPLLKWGEL